jgi:hypothetical protein
VFYRVERWRVYLYCIDCPKRLALLASHSVITSRKRHETGDFVTEGLLKID